MDSLVFLCGAGLSIPSPSNLLSAAGISHHCYDRFRRQPKLLITPLREDIDQFADHFHAEGDFKVFIRLVPWNDLVGTPNKVMQR